MIVNPCFVRFSRRRSNRIEDSFHRESSTVCLIMSTWRRRFSRKPCRSNENDEILVTNAGKYRKKLQAAITQVNRTKKSVQRNFDSSDADVHIARLINDIGQLSDCKPLQEVTSLIDSLAMRHQLSSRIFNEYAMNALEQALEKMNDDLSKDFDRTKSVLEEAQNTHCSTLTKNQLTTKVQNEWSKHQKLALKELKQSLSAYCHMGSHHLKVQMTILQKLQNFIDQLPSNENADVHQALPDFTAQSVQTRQDIDTMLRVMLDTASNDSASLPDAKRPKFLNNHHPLSNRIYSPEITEAVARSRPSSSTRPEIIPFPSEISLFTPLRTPQHQSTIITSHDATLADADQLPSYTDLFVVPNSCRNNRTQRRN